MNTVKTVGELLNFLKDFPSDALIMAIELAHTEGAKLGIDDAKTRESLGTVWISTICNQISS